ncbi:MAG: peptidoglycan DD-metalloendopeptidase family protein [Candidatus Aegiribacteria sp.]|nr:peptidoglycan DD-metalloendopeptidase family protein [Candidatus Aegiribacteria sp.]
MTALIFAAVLISSGSLDSLDACMQETQEEIARLEDEEAALSTILDAIHQHILTSRSYYNELALEEAAILQQLGRVSSVFTAEDSLREALVESLSSYMLYLYSHRNLGGIGSFFVEGGFSRMLHRQAYIDYLASKAAGEVFMLSISQDSLGSFRDSLEVLLVNVQQLRQQMTQIQEGIYAEEARQASMRNQIMGRISAAEESLAVLEDRRISRAEFVTQLSVRSSPVSVGTPITEPDMNSYIEQQRGNINWPADGQVVRGFGIETHQRYGTQTISDGITVVTPPSQGVCASASGVVLWAGEFLSMGQMVVVDHQDGYFTIYGYLGQLMVSPDDEISVGFQLGRTGSVPGGQPGYYFEIRRGGEPVNPVEYLK